MTHEPAHPVAMLADEHTPHVWFRGPPWSVRCAYCGVVRCLAEPDSSEVGAFVDEHRHDGHGARRGR